MARAPSRPASRQLSAGAEVVRDGTRFRVWAPARRRVELALEGPDEPRSLAMEPEDDGWFAVFAPGVGDGARYRYRLDGDLLRPDPASRFQPEGPFGPSEVIDPCRYRWSDAAWPGAGLRGAVIYELHLGTYTREGTYAAAATALARLAGLGLTVIELMPIAEFPGAFGWGYDGVDLYAPSHLYGRPDELRALVDRAHALGLGVILDVVYNHLGPAGNHLTDFAPGYFTDRYRTEWGKPLDFDGPASGPVRAFVVENAAYWVREFHLDGLRLDATQAIFDASPEHVVAAIGRAVRDAAAGRATLVVGENEPQDARLLRPVAEGGCGLDGMWNDDFHHAAVAAATGHREAYYQDTPGAPQELVSAAKHGFLFQGQWYAWQGKRRGAPAGGVPRAAFVCSLENHDQVANSAHGQRLHQLTSPGRHRALTALLLLGPWTPMLFQGQEGGACAPFLYFADHAPLLAAKVRAGRAEFLRQFPSIAWGPMRDRLDDPGAATTFERCKLDPTDLDRRPELVALHRDLLELRRTDPTLVLQGEGGLDGAVIGPEAFVLRFAGPGGDDRVLLVNLGADLDRPSVPEPLLAPPAGLRWEVRWTSEHPRYGGSGQGPLEDAKGFHLRGHAAALLAPAPEEAGGG